MLFISSGKFSAKFFSNTYTCPISCNSVQARRTHHFTFLSLSLHFLTLFSCNAFCIMPSENIFPFIISPHCFKFDKPINWVLKKINILYFYLFILFFQICLVLVILFFPYFKLLFYLFEHVNLYLSHILCLISLWIWCIFFFYCFIFILVLCIFWIVHCEFNSLELYLWEIL